MKGFKKITALFLALTIVIGMAPATSLLAQGNHEILRIVLDDTIVGAINQADATITFNAPGSSLQGTITDLQLSPGADALAFYTQGIWWTPSRQGSSVSFSDGDLVFAHGPSAAASVQYTIIIDDAPALRIYNIAVDMAASDDRFTGYINQTSRIITFRIPEDQLEYGLTIRGAATFTLSADVDVNAIQFQIENEWWRVNYGQSAGFSNGHFVRVYGNEAQAVQYRIIVEAISSEEARIYEMVLNGSFHGVINQNGRTIIFEIPENYLLHGARFEGAIAFQATDDAEAIELFVANQWWPVTQNQSAGFSNGNEVRVRDADVQAIVYTIYIVPLEVTIPTPVEITITQDLEYVYVDGITQRFAFFFLHENGVPVPANNAEWTVDGLNETVIVPSGPRAELIIDSNETAEILTITATSHNPNATGPATATLRLIRPVENTTISITPSVHTVRRGVDTVTLPLTLLENGVEVPADRAIWTVSGRSTAQTRVDVVGGVATLFVWSSETSQSLTITATPLDTSIAPATAAITVEYLPITLSGTTHHNVRISESPIHLLLTENGQRVPTSMVNWQLSGNMSSNTRLRVQGVNWVLDICQFETARTLSLTATTRRPNPANTFNATVTVNR